MACSVNCVCRLVYDFVLAAKLMPAATRRAWGSLHTMGRCGVKGCKNILPHGVFRPMACVTECCKTGRFVVRKGPFCKAGRAVLQTSMCRLACAYACLCNLCPLFSNCGAVAIARPYRPYCFSELLFCGFACSLFAMPSGSFAIEQSRILQVRRNSAALPANCHCTSVVGRL